MQPTRFQITTLTAAQRLAIIDLQTHISVKVYVGKNIQVYKNLVAIGAAVLHPSSGLQNEFVIAAGWETVDVKRPARGSREDTLANKVFGLGEEAGVIPDPPKKKIQRPPAIYSNRSYDEVIDHVLKNY